MEDSNYEPLKISCPYEPYGQPEIATMNAIDFLMSQLGNNGEKDRVAFWINSKYNQASCEYYEKAGVEMRSS